VLDVVSSPYGLVGSLVNINISFNLEATLGNKFCQGLNLQTLVSGHPNFGEN
jgi:hypothetical protein